MKKMFSAFIAMLMSSSFVLSQAVMALELPNLEGMASEAASGISDAMSGISEAAAAAGENISNAAAAAGENVSNSAGQAGDFVSELAGNVGTAVSGAAQQVADVSAGFASQAGKVLSDWGRQAGETADTVKEQLSDAGVAVQTSAKELGSATAQKASELTEQAGKGADNAINAVSGAADYVVDQAGHVVDLAAVGADYVSDGAMEVYGVLQEYGSLLMKIAEDAVSEIDLSKTENWEKTRTIVYRAIDKAYESGLIDREKISEATMRTAASIVFSAMMYGYQYQNNVITLGEYVSNMSEVLIREGLPTGVGFLITLLPINIPHADSMAKEVTYYLISLAYGDNSGAEIEKEEETLLEQVEETETEQ